jgi:hypothetical protein
MEEDLGKVEGFGSESRNGAAVRTGSGPGRQREEIKWNARWAVFRYPVFAGNQAKPEKLAELAGLYCASGAGARIRVPRRHEQRVSAARIDAPRIGERAIATARKQR